MSFEIKSDGVDVEAIMRAIRKRIEEKKQGLYTDDEIREIAEHRLDAVLDAHDFNPDLVEGLPGPAPSAGTSPSTPRPSTAAAAGLVGRLLRAAARRAAAGPEAVLEPEPR